MSQRDLARELRAARSSAPFDVRERVRLIAADDTTPTRRFTWRRALVVALPVAAAVAATIVFTRPAGQHEDTTAARDAATVKTFHAPAGAAKTAPNAGSVAGQGSLAPVSPTPNRVQQVEATLSLRMPTVEAVSTAVQRALRIAKSLGGYPVYVDAGSRVKTAQADLTLKVPRAHVREAVSRLSALGTITAEHLDIQDLQAGLNDTDRTIARLQRKLAALRAPPQTPPLRRQIASLTARIAQLQRQKAATIRTAHYATVDLHLATPQVAAPHKAHHGPLHRLGIALEWLGVGAIYVLVLGTPVVLVAVLVWLGVRSVRRRREDALLGQP
jgi:Domain of unknown function (DUF4349)